MTVQTDPAMPVHGDALEWWARPGLGYRQGRLHMGTHDLAAKARALGTPCYAYHEARALDNLERLREALSAQGNDFQVYYAMKSNRHLPLLTRLRLSGKCGVDVSSPGEARRALEVGWPADRISFTASGLSARDLEEVARVEGMHVNLDSFEAMRGLAALCPGREIGLRVDPGLGIGYRSNELLRYSGARPGKFGFEASDLATCLAEADRLGLRVAHLHAHAGCGYLTPQLPRLREILGRLADLASSIDGLRSINIGGGLGIPLEPDDAPLDLGAWAAVVADTVGRLGLEVRVEPGDYIAKDTGVLLVEVTAVTEKGGHTFVSVDAGHNIHPEPVWYGLPCWIVPVEEPTTPQGAWPTVTVVGNINEALDEWARDIPLGPVRPGDLLAMLNAGGYGASMSSNHCLRGAFSECLLP